MYRPLFRSVVVVASTLVPLQLAFAEPDELEIEVEATPSPVVPPATPPVVAPLPPVVAIPPAVAPAETLVPPPSLIPAESADVASLRAQLAALEARLASIEAAAPPPAPPVLVTELPPKRKNPWVDDLNLRVSGLIQPQVVFSQLSQDEVSPDGRALNQDRFYIRRGRLRVDRDWKYAHATLEIDANTTRGPFVSLRRAEGSVFWPNPTEGRLPYARLTAGLTEIPFGYELRQGVRDRMFMERTVASLAFFTGEPDVGARVDGAFGPLRYDIALQNGLPVDDRPNAVTTVYQAKKTGVGRVGFETNPDAVTGIAGGISYLSGSGFHEGTPATKSQLSWNDANQDGFITLNELVPITARAATPSSTFRRWAMNADLSFRTTTPAGDTHVYGEVTMASNLDRGYSVADPVSTGYDLREFAWNIAAVQDVSEFGVVGFRIEAYNPNSDLFEARRGEFIPTNASITTLSPLVGVTLDGLGRIVLQYDYVSDHLGRDARGEPIDLPNDLWTLRTQVQF